MVQTRALLALALLLLVSNCALAQSDTATISGRITEQSGAVLTGVEVRAINIDTGVRSATVTNQEGLYVIRDLHPGSYRLVVDKLGFRQIVLTGLILNLQDAIGRNFTMQIGSIIQSVTLVAGAAEVDTSPAVSTVVDQQFVQNMPLNGRSFQSLISLTPGFEFVATSDAAGGSAPGQFSVNGQRGNANYFTVDGVSANFPSLADFDLGQTVGGTTPAFTITGGTNGLLSVDAMQEFRVQTSSFAPEYGHTPGAQISIVTRSGTNELHGTAYDYLRNDAFDARNYFDQPPLPKPPLRQNDFGGTLGGPIVHNRTFFFFSYEGLRLLEPETSTGTFYTAAARANVAPAYQPLLAALPLPDGPVNSDGITAPLTVAYSNPTNIDTFSLRVDQNFTSRWTLFARYNHSPSIAGFRYWSELRNSTINTDSATAGLTLTLSPTKLNDFRANWGQQTAGESTIMDNFRGAVPPPDSAMFPSGYSSRTSQFVLEASDGEVRSGPIANNVQRQLNFVDTFSLGTGAHQVKFGGDFRRLTPTSGVYDYSLVVFAGYASMQSDIADSVSTFAGASITSRINNLSLFAQDVWKASPHLTLTYGLRWEINTPPVSITPGKPLYAVTGIFDSQPFGLAPAGTPLWHTHYNDFAPRVGASYQLTPQTVLRGAFGLFYDLGYGGGIGGTMSQFPYSRNKSVFTPVPFDFTNPAFDAPPFTLVPNQSTLYMDAFDPNLRLPLTFEWNAAFERALGANQSISATYVGAYGIHLLREDSIQNNPSGSPTVFSTLNSGWSHYNALQLQYQRRLTRGLQALVSYTFAKSMDTNSSDVCQCSYTNNIQNVNVAADYSASDFDVRNTFAGAVSYQLPAPDWGKASGILLRNWQVDSIVRISSAPPFDLVALAISPQIGYYYTRPDVVPGVPFYLPAPGQPRGRVLNPAAFAVPPNGEYGNLPRNYFRDFPIDQTDLALSRQIGINDQVSLYVRAEYFNLFNHPMFSYRGNFDNYLGNPNFGTVTQTLNEELGGLDPQYQIGGPRSAQLTVKLQF